MKSFMQPKSGILRNNPSAEPSSSPNPSPSKQRSSRRQKENAPPLDPNALPDSALSPSLAAAKSAGATGKSRSPLPPRPPTSNSNPLKRKLNTETVLENGVPGNSDSGVKVIVRMRPPNKDEEEGELILQKVSSDSLSFLGQTFTFDSVADSGATQQDIFQLVGAPLVENCLAGFNSSIFAYGQTGSGKTYTMCGPANALLEKNSSSNQQGLTPRVFEKLFERINEEQIKHAEKQLKYQCRCSFLEIYNEQITDLLDPNQKNLQVREDVKTGVYVENLTEEYVCTMKDVKQLLIKGLSNRKTGATSLNAESSRSHSVFTCIVESRCKSMADGLSSFRTSRINLVDLAGSERQKLTGTAGERLKEAGNINRSLSQLGNLINILAEVSQTGKQRHIPYRDSRLTFLLQESLGGNAKLAMICAISLAPSCKSETLSTLRFAQRAKAIKNKAVVNEVMQDDVNVLREVIRQLRDELLIMKANGNSTDTNGGYSTGWNARRSLNLLKFSLNRPMTLPHIEDDSDEEMEIDEEAVERLCIQVGLQSADFEENNIDGQRNLKTCQSDLKVEACKESILGEEKQIDPPEIGCSSDQGYEENDVHMQDCQLEEMVSEEFKNNELADGCSEPVVQAPISPKLDGLGHQSHAENNNTEGSTGRPIQAIEENLFVSSDHKLSKVLSGKVAEAKSSADISVGGGSADTLIADPSHNSPKGSPDSVLPLNISIVPCKNSPVHQSPTLSVSPRVSNSSRKGLKATSLLLASQKNLRENNNLGPEVLQFSLPRPSTKTSKNSLSPTEYLAASLHHGLQVIDSHIQSSALRRSSFRFSCKPVDMKPLLPVDKVDVGVQTLFQDPATQQVDSSAFFCSQCKRRASQVKSKEANNCSGLELVPAKEAIDCSGLELVPVKEANDCLGLELVPVNEANDCSGLELVPVDGSDCAENSRIQVPKAVEKVLAGAIRREMAIEEFSGKQAAEIMQLNRLVQQYKQERECNAIIEQMREDKIIRLESLMDSILPAEEYMEQELVSLMHEHKLLKEKYDNHPEVLRTKIELKRVQDELDSYRNFFDMGERDVLLEEIQHLRSQLQYYIHSSPMPARKQCPLLQLTYSCKPTSATLCGIPESSEENANERSEQEKHLSSCILESTEESAEEKFNQERRCWTEAESKWISLSEELRIELEANRSISEKQKQELEAEKRCCEELKEALQMAMQGHAHILEQYAELEERHIALLARHRKIQEGVGDIKKAAAKAGVKGAESRFINSLAAEISTLKVEKEREICYLRDENKGLQGQLRDTAEAVQAAGELLVRLKEAEEAVAIFQKRALEAEHNAEKAYKQINKLKKKQKTENTSMNQLLEESPLPKEVLRPVCDDSNLERYDGEESLAGAHDQQWREEFVPFHHGEDGGDSKLAEPSWFSGYDRCNV